MSKAERLLSYSLLSLITSTPLASAPMTGLGEEEGEADNDKVRKGHLNAAGAWCWREGCDGTLILFVFHVFDLSELSRDRLRLTKAMQKTAETLQSVADLYDNHVRNLFQ